MPLFNVFLHCSTLNSWSKQNQKKTETKQKEKEKERPTPLFVKAKKFSKLYFHVSTRCLTDLSYTFSSCTIFQSYLNLVIFLYCKLVRVQVGQVDPTQFGIWTIIFNTRFEIGLGFFNPHSIWVGFGLRFK